MAKTLSESFQLAQPENSVVASLQLAEALGHSCLGCWHTVSRSDAYDKSNAHSNSLVPLPSLRFQNTANMCLLRRFAQDRFDRLVRIRHRALQLAPPSRPAIDAPGLASL